MELRQITALKTGSSLKRGEDRLRLANGQGWMGWPWPGDGSGSPRAPGSSFPLVWGGVLLGFLEELFPPLARTKVSRKFYAAVPPGLCTPRGMSEVTPAWLFPRRKNIVTAFQTASWQRGWGRHPPWMGLFAVQEAFGVCP